MELDARVCDRARLARDPRFDGRFYIAVLSTGIYCRPICPSPTARRENVRYFGTAEEAVAAGFRPCLRCRPEAAPGTPRWRGTSSTVSRALRLIEEGALQTGTLIELSRRLGVSARHLHRLFATHLGTSPIAVAKTWRLYLAKHLITDTDLPMSRVAFAAGFRTVRRFNDSIREFYGRTPSELRRQQRGALHASRDDYVFRLPYRPPYDWDSLVSFLAARAIPGIEDTSGGVYRRTFSQAGSHGTLQVRHEPDGRCLETRVRFAAPISLLPIVSRVRTMFDLSGDTAAITRHFRGDPLLGPLVRTYPGLRIPGAWDAFEMWVRALLGESGSGAGAAPARAAGLARRFGEPLSLSGAGPLAYVFPTPRALAAANGDEPGPDRLDVLRDFARAIVSAGRDGETPEADLLERAARGRLAGEGAAAYVELRAFGQPDAFPEDDPVLLGQASARPESPGELAAIAERWRPWRGYAAMYLWRAAARPSRPAAELERARRAG